MFLLPAFYLQGWAPAPEFAVSSGAPGLSSAAYPGAPNPAGAGPSAPTVVPPTTTTAVARELAAPAPPAAPTTTSSSTTAPRAAPSTTTTASPPTTSAPPTTEAPAPTTSTTRAPSTTTAGGPGPIVSLPTALRPLQQAGANSDRGVASWFGAPAATCAHRTLPFGTVIKVTRVSTGVSTECTVDDWGPADTTRVIDLSTDTFERLAEAWVGLIEVVIEW